jgi:hypothetical protein
MIVLLIISIFIVLFYILYKTSKETFQNNSNSKKNNNSANNNSNNKNSANKNSANNDDKDITLNYTLNNKIDGPIAYIKNIDTFSNGFYEQLNHNNPTQSDCKNDEECGLNGICLDRNGLNRCNKIINKEAFRFIPQSRSHIVIPNVNPNNLNLNFIVMINNVTREAPLISTSNETWGLGIENKKFVVFVVTDNEIKKYFSQNELKDNKLYEVILRVYNNTINISLDKRIISIPLEKRLCLNDNDCGENGFCERSSTGNNYCSYNRIELLLGKHEDEYFDGFIGDIFLNFDKNEDKILSCDFDSKSFKNRRICEEECIRNNNCDNASCERLCSNVQKCEFEPIGRHSEDCIQQCRMNEDCDNTHCNEKCKNCGQSCPWNDLDSSDRFDSDYYDKKGRPSPPRISIMNISSDGRKIELRWKPPFKGMGEIEGYITYLYKTFNKSEGVKINNISTNNCGEFCNYIMDGLNPLETYTLGIKGYNYLGLGKMSNLITFKPDRKSINQDFSIVPNIDESIIGEFNYCNVDEE